MAGGSQAQPAFSKLQINSKSAELVPKRRSSLVPWAVGDKMPGSRWGVEVGGHFRNVFYLMRPLHSRELFVETAVTPLMAWPSTSCLCPSGSSKAVGHCLSEGWQRRCNKGSVNLKGPYGDQQLGGHDRAHAPARSPLDSSESTNGHHCAACVVFIGSSKKMHLRKYWHSPNKHIGVFQNQTTALIKSKADTISNKINSY